MAYLYCRDCDWSQDDFWDKRYNPISFFLRNYLTAYIWPRMIQFDPPPHSYGRIHSWRMLWIQIRRAFGYGRYRRMKWWTYKSWQRAVEHNGGKWPSCPDCQTGRLGMD